MEWLPVVAAVICILISIPLSKLLKINFAYLALAAVLAFLATFTFPSFFDQSRSLQDVMEKTFKLGGGLVLFLCATAIIVMWAYEKRKQKKQQAEKSPEDTPAKQQTGAAKPRPQSANQRWKKTRMVNSMATLSTQSAQAPSCYTKLHEEVLNKEPETDEVLLHTASLKEQRVADAMEMTALDAEEGANREIDIAEYVAALEIIEEVEAALLAAFNDITEESERTETVFDALEKAVATQYVEPPVPETETGADDEADPLTAALDSAYAAMAAADWQCAFLYFQQALTVTEDPYATQRIKLELLNMHMRLDRRREATDIVFDILGAGYKLNNAETATLFNVLQELEKGVK